MSTAQIISYAQRFEDLYLMRCFGGRDEGFYIDIGSGHPVYDNMSFVFYLKGWNGVTVEPNPWLARLTTAVRPRDRHLETLVGAAPGAATLRCRERLRRPLDHDRRPCAHGGKPIRKGFKSHCRPGDNAQGTVRTARAA